jgi:hypothetical protein
MRKRIFEKTEFFFLLLSFLLNSRFFQKTKKLEQMNPFFT